MHDIKSLKPQNGRYHQGYITKLLHPEKYVGNYPIIYRSSWEKKLCEICDKNSSILKWISEPNDKPFPINYYHPIEDRIAHYFPDYLIMKKEFDGSSNMLIEVKPESQTPQTNGKGEIVLPPKPKPNASVKQRQSYIKNCQTLLINLAKKNAAEKFCEQYSNPKQKLSYHFLTEAFFSNYNI